MQSMITTQFDKATEITKGTQQTNKQTNGNASYSYCEKSNKCTKCDNKQRNERETNERRKPKHMGKSEQFKEFSE